MFVCNIFISCINYSSSSYCSDQMPNESSLQEEGLPFGSWFRGMKSIKVRGGVALGVASSNQEIEAGEHHFSAGFLLFLFAVSPGPQLMEWCHPHSRISFPSSVKDLKITLTDIPKGVPHEFFMCLLELTKLTMKFNCHST